MTTLCGRKWEDAWNYFIHFFVSDITSFLICILKKIIFFFWVASDRGASSTMVKIYGLLHPQRWSGKMSNWDNFFCFCCCCCCKCVHTQSTRYLQYPGWCLAHFALKFKNSVISKKHLIMYTQTLEPTLYIYYNFSNTLLLRNHSCISLYYTVS